MQAHSLLLARTYTERPEHVHDGKVIVMRSNLRSPVGLNHVWMAPAWQEACDIRHLVGCGHVFGV